MKLKELKHNHSLTDLLKVLIFSILMITPLLSVATRCLYVICNKNAYQSAEITQTKYDKQLKYETNEVNIDSDLIPNHIYKLDLDYLFNCDNGQFIYLYDVSVILITPNEEDANTHYIQYFSDNTFNFNKTGTDIYFDNDEYGYPMINVTLEPNSPYFNPNFYIILHENFILTNCEWDLNDDINEIFDESDYFIYDYVEVESTTLDNVFEYSVNKLAESPILSWTQQTAIYTGVSTMTTQLGVNTPTIPMLIVYWFLLTVIYIIIDIIIKLFTWLTHMIGSKSV